MRLIALLGSTTAEELAGNKVVVAQCVAQLPLLHQRATAPAMMGGVRAVLEPLFTLFPQGEKTDAEWKTIYAMYADACGHLPTSALAQAMRVWVKSPQGRFMPKPGELLELATKADVPAIMAYERARQIIRLDEEKRRVGWDGVKRPVMLPPFVRDPPAVRAKVYAEHKAATAARATELREQWRAREAAKPMLHGELMEGRAITEQMNSAIVRQAEREGGLTYDE